MTPPVRVAALALGRPAPRPTRRRLAHELAILGHDRVLIAEAEDAADRLERRAGHLERRRPADAEVEPQPDAANVFEVVGQLQADAVEIHVGRQLHLGQTR